ncbi:MAG: TatD family hydrolase, partial [Alphaproteobacteria bacterium]|nr:TatD family hydrolase [Alphaproteobacteria bacterium]
IRAIAERFDNVFCSVGLHPHEAAGEPELTPERLIELAAHPKVVGIGETGLDFHYDNSPREDQRRQFRTHIAAARQTGLPLIVHTREADQEMADILRQEMAAGQFNGVLHCFSSERPLAEAAVELGLYISISGIVTFKKAEALRDIVRQVPLERLLVETDAPYLAPAPHRGKTNEPAYVAHTAAKLAELKGLGVADLARATTENFHRLFARARPVTLE